MVETDGRREILSELLHRAGEAALSLFRETPALLKPDGTHVTEADRRSEEVLVEGLMREFPRDSVVAEEGTHVTGSEGTWFVDPIDGTSSYLEGLAYWGPTVCRVREGRLEVGATLFPRLGEYWFAARGAGAYRNGIRLAPTDPGGVGRNDALFLPSRFHRRQPIPWPGKVRALGSSAAHLAHVASGGAAAAILSDWAIWDVGAGILLVTESGRDVSDLTGHPIDPIQRPGHLFAAGAPSALRAIVQMAGLS